MDLRYITKPGITTLLRHLRPDGNYSDVTRAESRICLMAEREYTRVIPVYKSGKRDNIIARYQFFQLFQKLLKKFF